MTNPITQMPKPKAGQYKENRKLFLVPMFMFSSDVPEEGQQILERYWSEVRDHINNLERSLGKVSHVYHETLFVEGEEGMRMLEQMNPLGYSFIQAICHSDGRLESTEDRALVEESSDWQRCISVGLVSQKVTTTALEGLQNATRLRYEHIGSRIDQTLKEGEAAVLFIGEDHRVQFPSDVQVFYVAPPALDQLKRWIDDQVRSARQRMEQASVQAEEEPPAEAEEKPPTESGADAEAADRDASSAPPEGESS